MVDPVVELFDREPDRDKRARSLKLGPARDKMRQAFAEAFLQAMRRAAAEKAALAGSSTEIASLANAFADVALGSRWFCGSIRIGSGRGVAQSRRFSRLCPCQPGVGPKPPRGCDRKACRGDPSGRPGNCARRFGFRQSEPARPVHRGDAATYERRRGKDVRTPDQESIRHGGAVEEIGRHLLRASSRCRISSRVPVSRRTPAPNDQEGARGPPRRLIGLAASLMVRLSQRLAGRRGAGRSVRRRRRGRCGGKT